MLTQTKGGMICLPLQNIGKCVILHSATAKNVKCWVLLFYSIRIIKVGLWDEYAVCICLSAHYHIWIIWLVSCTEDCHMNNLHCTETINECRDSHRNIHATLVSQGAGTFAIHVCVGMPLYLWCVCVCTHACIHKCAHYFCNNPTAISMLSLQQLNYSCSTIKHWTFAYTFSTFPIS